MYNIIGYEDYQEYNTDFTLGPFKEIDEGYEINSSIRLPFNTIIGVQDNILEGSIAMKETLNSMKLHLEDLRKLLKLRD